VRSVKNAGGKLGKRRDAHRKEQRTSVTHGWTKRCPTQRERPTAKGKKILGQSQKGDRTRDTKITPTSANEEVGDRTGKGTKTTAGSVEGRKYTMGRKGKDKTQPSTRCSVFVGGKGSITLGQGEILRGGHSSLFEGT